MVKNPPAMRGIEPRIEPGSGRSPGKGHGYPPEYPCLKNPHRRIKKQKQTKKRIPIDRGAWWVAIHGSRVGHN